jgi:hypothetical protein
VGDIAQSDLGVATANAIVRAILDGTYRKVHNVLLCQRGKLVLEEYFYGYSAGRTQQLRSVGHTGAGGADIGRHTYATEMLRSGVSFPVLMKLLGHVDPAMTMRYVDVALTDLEREFRLARSKPRHLAPQPKTSTAPIRADLDGLIDSLVAAQHVMESFRRSRTDGNVRKRLRRLSIRLIKVVTEIKKLQSS